MLIRLTVRRLMAAVAVLGVVLGAFRTHFSLGSFVAGLVGIAWIETNKWIKRREAADLPAGVVATVGTFLRSMAIAAGVIVGSALPLVVVSPLLVPRSSRQHGSAGPGMLIVLAPLGIYATMWTARILRRWFGSDPVTPTPKPAPEPCDETVGAGVTAFLEDR